jgi:hypothetical protein
MSYLIAVICLATPWQWADENIPTSGLYQVIDKYTPTLIKSVTEKVKSFN